MRRLASFPVLFSLALACFIVAVHIAPAGYCPTHHTTRMVWLLIVLGSGLALGSVAVPWFRYVLEDGGEIDGVALLIGIGGGLLVTGLLFLIPLVTVFHLDKECY